MTPSQSKRIADIVVRRYNSLYSSQSEIFEAVEEYRQLYRCFMNDPQAYPWDYQLVDPQVFPLMRAYIARLSPADAQVLLESRTGEDLEALDTNQKIVNWELSEIALTQIFHRQMFSGFMAGHGYLESGWKYVPALEVETDSSGTKMRKKLRDITNRADLGFVRFNDMFIPNRNIPSIVDQPYTIQRKMISFTDMVNENKIAAELGIKPKWKQAAINKIKSTGNFTNTVDYGVDMPVESSSKTELERSAQYVEVLLMETKDGEVYYIDKKGNEMLNESSDPEFWHSHSRYIDFAPFPEDDEFFSMGIVQPIADLQIALSSSLSQLVTNARKSANPMFITSADAATVPDWQFVNRPYGVIRTSGASPNDSIQPFVTPDTSNGLLGMRNEVQGSLERTTAISSLFVSGAGGAQVNKTATGAKVISDNIDINMQLLIQLFGAQVLKTVGEHCLELNAQFMTDEQIVKVTKKPGQAEYVKVSPEEISANFDVRVSPERMMKSSPAVRQSSLLNLLNTLVGVQKIVPMNLAPVVEAVIDSYPETENINDIVIDAYAQAQEVIRLIMMGIEPLPPKPTDDLKSLISYIQQYILENPGITDKQLMDFQEYISDVKLLIEAKDQKLVADPQDQVNAAQQPSSSLIPTDEASLLQSMSGGGMTNPTDTLPMQITQQQLGMNG